MKKIEYNFFNLGKPVSERLVVGVYGKNWKRHMVRDQWGNFSSGYFSACRREPTDAEL